MISWFFDNYGEFEGRAGRKEFWLYILIYNAVNVILLGITIFFYDLTWLIYIVNIIVFIPSWAVAVRRLHDTGQSGWLSLLWLVPVLGQLVLIYFWCLPGEYGNNRYGYPRG